MKKTVEIPDTQFQKVTLLVTMDDYSENDLDAGHWLLEILSMCADKSEFSAVAAKTYRQAMRIVSVEDCEIVVCDGV